MTSVLAPIVFKASSNTRLLPYSPSVGVTFSIHSGVVTSVDTGVPVNSYPADGSQTDGNNTPYPPGTVLLNDGDGHPQLAGDNISPNPTVTVNATQTWAVTEVDLRRNSLIFDKPSSFGRFHTPINWT